MTRTISNTVEDSSGATRKRFIQVISAVSVFLAIYFVAAGRLNIPTAWIFFGVYLLYLVILSFFLKDPELMEERSSLKPETKSWDITFNKVYRVLGLITPLVAGLDQRFGWSGEIPTLVSIIALTGIAAGFAILGWAMNSNTFFSVGVRIQRERNHHVISDGPYRYIRHPGYVGAIISSLGTPLILGSLWALIPSGMVIIAFLWRTRLEDKTLHEELDGYSAYTKKVQYRLIPGIW